MSIFFAFSPRVSSGYFLVEVAHFYKKWAYFSKNWAYFYEIAQGMYGLFELF